MLIYAEPLPRLFNIAGSLFRPNPDNIAPIPGVFFSLGRDALAAAIDTLYPGVDEIWLPAYVCGELIAVLRSRPGMRLRFYDIKDDLSPDWQSIGSREAPYLIVLIHYFGFLNDIKGAQDFQQANPSAKIIEDGAHMLPFALDRTLTVGESAIFSWRKFLAVPDGALLTWRQGAGPTAPPADRNIPWAWIARTTAKRLFKFAPAAVYGRKPLRETGVAEPAGPVKGVSRLSLALLARALPNLEAIIRRRRRNYELLTESAGEFGVKPVYRLSRQSPGCPYVFAFRVKDRDKVIAAVRNHGVAAQFWPTLPAEVKESAEYPVANRVFNEVVTLPIHQDLGDGEIRKIASALKGAVS